MMQSSCSTFCTHSEAFLGQLFSGELLLFHLLFWLLCRLFLFLKDHLNVRWARHVRANTTMRTVCSSTSLLCCIHLNVFDDQIVSVQIFELGITFGILQQTQNDFTRLYWPSSLCRLERHRLRCPTDATLEFSKWNALFLLTHCLKIRLCCMEGHPLDGLSSFICVFEMHTQ